MTPRRFRVQELVGRGGFGAVYKAELQGEGGFSKTVAIKVLDPKMEDLEEIAGRLRDEARILGLLRHRAVVQVDGLLRLDDRWTVVMEYIDGVDLHNLLRSTRVPLGPALEVIAEVAGALQAAWDTPGPDGRPLHLLHRDIKPSNLQITRFGEVKLLDFGIARADFDRREARTRSLAMGTDAYMSPERRDLIDTPAGDVYALGVTLYEMLLARRFGMTSSNRERHEALVASNMEFFHRTFPGSAVADLLYDLLDYEPERRPNAGELERRCHALRGEDPGMPLRYWAEKEVPIAQARRKPPRQGDEVLDGTILVERVSGVPEVPPAARAAFPAWALAVPALLGVGLLGVAGALLLGGEPTSGEVPDPPLEMAAPEVASPPREVEAAAEPAPPKAAEPRAPAEARPAPPRSPEPPPAEASPAPAAEAVPEKPKVEAPKKAATGRVSVSGDAAGVRLRKAGEVREPGEVPVGTWTVEADFGQGYKPAGNVEVAEGAQVTLRCSAAFKICKP